MARKRGGKRFNSKTPAAAQESTSHIETASPVNHKSKFPYVCSTCSKGYVLRDSFLAHTLIHTREKLRNVKPKRQHQRELRPTSSISPTTVPSVWEAELGRSIEGQTSSISPTTVPSVSEAELGRSLEGQTSSISTNTVPSAWEAEPRSSLNGQTSSLSPTTVPSVSEAESRSSLKGQTSSISPTTIPSAWEAELGRSLEGQTCSLYLTTVPSVSEAEPRSSLKGQTSSISPTTIPSAWDAELGRSLEDPSSSFFSSFASPATAATLDTHLEDEIEFGQTSFSFLSSTPAAPFLSSTPAAPRSATKRPKDSVCVTDVTIPDPSGPKMLKKHASIMQDNNDEAEPKIIIPDPSGPKILKKQSSNMQDNNNEAEPTIIISDDEEDSETQTPETVGNYKRFMSTPTVSTSDLDVTSFKIVEMEQEYSVSVMYTTPPKAPNVLYKDSGTSETVSHSYPLPKAKMNHGNQGDTTVIISDDDEPMTPMKTGSSKKKNVAKRLFSNFPLRQNQIRNGGFDSLSFKSGEHKSKANPIENSSGDIKEALDKINQLGPFITITKTKTTPDMSNKTKEEAIDKIRQLGPAISLTRLNE